jgi:alkylhydroperoxidase/carboxymuconolactone decarboxylase family protein YurZ
MKRQILVEYKDASQEVKVIYDEIMEIMGSPTVPNFLKALGNNENVLRAIWSMMKHTIIDGEIPSLLKQLILFKISVNSGNEYCTALHGHAALNLDPTLSYDDLVEMSDGKTSTKLPASFQVAIEIREIDELMAQAYFAVMMNTFVDSFDIPWESPFPPEIE